MPDGIESAERFPGENPHPVLRMRGDGVLMYANPASVGLLRAWGVRVGERLAESVVETLRVAALEVPPGRVEAVDGRTTFAVLSVAVPDLDAYNLYGTDVTAAKVIERFPDRNPYPVLRIKLDGSLWYANEASRPITEALAIKAGERLPIELFAALQAVLADPSKPVPEVAGLGGRTYRIRPVLIPEFEFINLYGSDITAEKAVDKFPGQNPNPVLRLSRKGTLTYANPASSLVRKALGAEVGEALEPDVFARLIAASEHVADPTLEVDEGGFIYRLRVVSVFEFDSINIYGTDITASRQVEILNADNERLLLNILPASIADRLRGGETVIADRFDDMAVLFADVVGFTAISASLSATALVELLNQVFTMFDQLAERFELEKIKTVGDAYMVVGGLERGHTDDPHQEAEPSHAAALADMGLAMIAGLGRFREATGLDLHARLGMHVGPAVAGVIGLKKFIYDVWGDTVNTASRMESSGVPGRVQVTSETYERLRDEFDFERRGMIDIKGKGSIETWLLNGRRDPPLDRAHA